MLCSGAARDAFAKVAPRIGTAVSGCVYLCSMDSNPRIGLIGSGSWATAIAKILLTNISELHWWVRREETRDHLLQFGRNPHYIQSIEFDTQKLSVSTDMQSVVDACDILIVAIPSGYLDATVQEHAPKRLKNKIIISAIKGMVVEYNSIPARYFHKEFGVPYERIGLIAGPCHAEEVAREKLSYLTVACPDLSIAQIVADAMATRYIRVRISEGRCRRGIGGGTEEHLRNWSGHCDRLGLRRQLPQCTNFQCIPRDEAVSCSRARARQRREGKRLPRGFVGHSVQSP